MKDQKTILVCPLDWGLGHATRLVPIIEMLLERNVRVVIGADNKPLEFLCNRFPQCETVRMPGYSPVYPKNSLFILKVVLDIPRILIEGKRAHKLLERVVAELNIDAVISDNRYEFWSDQVPTIFITHQLQIHARGLINLGRPIFQKIVYRYIAKHNELWIPDFAGEPNLSGKMSHVKKMPKKNVFYIGLLSRFQKYKSEALLGRKYDILCIMSGPEPQRTILEDIFVNQAMKVGYKTLILSGKPGENKVEFKGNVEIRSHSSDEEMAVLINSAGMIYSRSGYTTVMDLAVLGKKAVFIPTPGQIEQEYLSDRLKEKGLYYSVSQKDFNIEDAFQKAERFSGIDFKNDYSTLNQRLDFLIARINLNSRSLKSV